MCVHSTTRQVMRVDERQFSRAVSKSGHSNYTGMNSLHNEIFVLTDGIDLP